MAYASHFNDTVPKLDNSNHNLVVGLKLRNISKNYTQLHLSKKCHEIQHILDIKNLEASRTTKYNCCLSYSWIVNSIGKTG